MATSLTVAKLWNHNNKWNHNHKSILKEISPDGRTDAEAETPILWLPDVKN